ncbi:Neuropeptide Y receptor type 1 [Frankliniella fusca]|uniref:Neuropeptide Y receptor type 1 n=1 Tax=Frankliniella fusca TaxID=407009 RepID=A0AAE1HSN9_9NEOP|nr:Neuropeptide Y receptor type 1 [Frankliniella fusca]
MTRLERLSEDNDCILNSLLVSGRARALPGALRVSRRELLLLVPRRRVTMQLHLREPDGDGRIIADSGRDEELYDVPVGIIVLLSIFYGTISAVAVLGNSLVIWIVATSRGMQNVTNYYIANLALADIVIGLFAIPFQFQAALLQRWILPHFMCPFCPFVQVLTVTVSVFTLTAIAIDRHRAILNPLR